MYLVVSIIIISSLALVSPILGFVAFLLALNFSDKIEEKDRKKNSEENQKRVISRHGPYAKELMLSLEKHVENGDALSKALMGQALLGMRFHFDNYTKYRHMESLLKDYRVSTNVNTEILSNFSNFPELQDTARGAALINEACQQGQYEALVAEGVMVRDGIWFTKDVEAGLSMIESAKNNQSHKTFLERSWNAVSDPELAAFADLLRIQTKKGELVRSEAERVIADKLFEAGINYQYERAWEGYAAYYKANRFRENKRQKVVYKNEKFPDFTIYIEDGRWIIWEHLGMLDNPEYLREWRNKELWYIDNGFIPGKTLLTSSNAKEIDEVFDFLLKEIGIEDVSTKQALTQVGEADEIRDEITDVERDNDNERECVNENETWKPLWNMINGNPVLSLNRDRAISMAKALSTQNSIVTRVRSVGDSHWVVEIRKSVRLSKQSVDYLEQALNCEDWVTVTHSAMNQMEEQFGFNSGSSEVDDEYHADDNNYHTEYHADEQEIRQDIASDVWDYARAEEDGWYYPD